MDFFAAQDEAKSRTKVLVVYFTAAVTLIIVAVYFAVTAGYLYFHHKTGGPNPPELLSISRFLITAGIVVPLVGFGSLWRITQLQRKGGPGVAEAMGGRKIDPSSKRLNERKLVNVVEEMAIASGIPVPSIYVMDHEQGINAFAAGFGIDDAAIGVTEGALKELDRDELQGVIAHEFSHVLNGDMSLSTKLSGWIFGIMMLTLLGRGFWALIKGGSGSGSRRRGAVYVGGSGRSRRGGGDSKGGGGALIIAIILVAVLITIVGFIGEFFARLIQAAVSREREYLADASAVQFTRNPEGIGNALRRIGGAPNRARIGHQSASEFSHAFFSKALRSEVSFLATHPPLERRIHRVLPDWDGNYLQPRPKKKTTTPEPEPKSKRGHAFGPRIGPDGGGGHGQFQTMLTAGLFMSCIGQMREQGRAYAESARLRLQDAFTDAFEDSGQSPLLILAMLYQKDDAVVERHREFLEDVVSGKSGKVAEYAEKIRALEPSEQLILLEMMASRLPEALAPGEREDFYACVRAMAEADQKISTFEMVCLQVVRRRLFTSGSQKESTVNSEAVLSAARILASRLAQETDQGDDRIEEILGAASRQAPYFTNQLKAAETTDYEAMDRAFEELFRSPLGIRKQFLQVCERIVAADEKATMKEVELLRAIAIGLGVPAAPIFPDEVVAAGEPS